MSYTDSLLSFFSYMKTHTDISRNLEPVINLSWEDTQTALFRAATSERIKITLEHIPDSAPVAIPVRIIEGMEMILERRTVTHAQYSLISKLFELINEKSFRQA